jgi:hypothetical protein
MEIESSFPYSQAPRPTPKLEDHPSSAVRDCLFNVFAAALHIGGRSSLRNLRTRHSVVTGTHKTRTGNLNKLIFSLASFMGYVGQTVLKRSAQIFCAHTTCHRTQWYSGLLDIRCSKCCRYMIIYV